MAFDVATAPAHYADLRDHLAPLLRELTPEQAASPVEACPGWSVSDVMAHVSGLVAETLAGIELPRGTPTGTARQVHDRRLLSLVEIVDEWCANGEAFATYGRDDPAYAAALTSDLIVHAGDIAEALDLDLDLDVTVVRKVAERYGATLQGRALDMAGIGLTLNFAHGVTLDPPGAGSMPLTLSVAAHDFLRSVTSRRSRDQVRALDWSGDPSALLDNGWSQYGPLPD